MFGTNTIGSAFSLSKLLGGISKGLTIANQVLPIYQQAKPMIQNARKVMSVLKEFNKTSNNGNVNNKTTVEVKAKEKTESKIQLNNAPVFFQ